MKNYQKIICALVTIFSVIIILTFRSIPSGQLWKSYNILYVPVSADDNTVISAIEKSGIENAVVLSKQYLPVNLSENSSEIAMYKLNRGAEEFSYAIDRNAYFFDKSNSYRLYYVPTQYKNKLGTCVSHLNSADIPAGVDSSAAYPWFLPLICLIAAVVLTLFSFNKFVFACGAAIPVLFCFCNPFYPVVFANLLVQLAIFFVSNLWNRKGFFKAVFSNFIVCTMVLLSFVCAFACSLKTGFLFVLCGAGAFSFIMCYSFVEQFINSRNLFVPVLIRPAKRISVYAGKANLILGTITLCAALFVILFVFTSSDTVSAHFAKIQLPAAKGFSADLPDLDDYCQWNWNVKTYPYRSLNKTSNENLIEFPRYVNDNGIIKETIQTMAFNQAYKDDLIDQIDYLPFDAIEKVMKSQNKEFSPGYAATTSYNIGVFGIIVSLLCLFVLLFLYISIIIKKGARK